MLFQLVSIVEQCKFRELAASSTRLSTVSNRLALSKAGLDRSLATLNKVLARLLQCISRLLHSKEPVSRGDFERFWELLKSSLNRCLVTGSRAIQALAALAAPQEQRAC